MAIPGSAAKARGAVSLFASLHGFSSDDLADIETAVGEAVANAIEHGNRMHGAFAIACTFEDDTLRISVSDTGAGFDSTTRPTVDTHPGRRTPGLRGYGIYLMRTLMNRVTYADGGTTVILEKILPGATCASESRETAP